jgi:hypothetical protein
MGGVYIVHYSEATNHIVVDSPRWIHYPFHFTFSLQKVYFYKRSNSTHDSPVHKKPKQGQERRDIIPFLDGVESRLYDIHIFKAEVLFRRESLCLIMTLQNRHDPYAHQSYFVEFRFPDPIPHVVRLPYFCTLRGLYSPVTVQMVAVEETEAREAAVYVYRNFQYSDHHRGTIYQIHRGECRVWYEIPTRPATTSIVLSESSRQSFLRISRTENEIHVTRLVLRGQTSPSEKEEEVVFQRERAQSRHQHSKCKCTPNLHAFLRNSNILVIFDACHHPGEVLEFNLLDNRLCYIPSTLPSLFVSFPSKQSCLHSFYHFDTL